MCPPTQPVCCEDALSCYQLGVYGLHKFVNVCALFTSISSGLDFLIGAPDCSWLLDPFDPGA